MIKLIGKRILAVILSGAILMSNMSAYAAEFSGGTAKECREASENEDTSIEVTEKSEETFGSAAASENLDAENSMQNGEDAENGNGNETQAVEESAADGTEAETKIKSEVESEIKMESEEESESGTKIESEEESESETKIESETESESETEAESEGILSQSTTAARASSKNSSSKDSVNQYMADAFLRDSCWINKDEVQGIPEAFYYAGELQDNYIWQNMESLWKAIELADGNPNLNSSPKTLYQAALMDILAEQVQLEKDLNSYSIEGDSIVTVMENISSGSDESKVIEETQKFIDLSAKGAAAAPMGEWISTNHNQIFKELSDVKVSIILASAQSTVSTGDEMYDYFIKVGELVQINDSMITALEDMYNHVDAAFSSNYKGTSVQKAAEKKIIQEAILEMINILKGDEFQEKLVGEADICIREGTSLGYNISISLLWDELGNINPEFQAVKWGLDNGINLSNLLFNIDNKIKDAAIANVRCKLHRIIQSGVKRSRQGYKSSRSDANAEMFVNYVYLLSDSYRVMLDTIHDYAKSTGIIKRFYLEEINASSLKFAGAFFESLVHVPIFNEDEEYKKYERSWLSKVTNTKAIPLNEIYNLYVKGLEQYVEQQKARKTAIKQIYTGISSSETADEQAKQTASEALELFETFVTYPSVTAPSESKIAEDEAKSKKHQLTYADQVISSGKTLDEDMMTYGNMTFSGGVLDLNGHTLAIYGDFYHTGGQIRFNKGTLIILGKYYCRKQSGVDNDGNSTYTSSSGTLRMTDATDKMQVSGDFYWRSNSLWTTDINASTSNNMLRAGTIEIGGNFQADDNWKPSTLEGDSHKEVFKNPEGTEVYFKSSSSYFSSVEFPEKAEGKDYYPITWSGAMKGFTLQQDMYLILPESKYPEGYQTLGTDGSINLNGHTLTIPGNVLHIGGNITFRGGTLDIRGNYEAKQFKNLDNNGNPIYTYGNVTLRMTDASDKMQVAGDFYWDSYFGWTTDINASTSSNMLRAGTIEIGGSFRAVSSWKPSTLEGDSHKEVFKNPEGTEVYFKSSSSYFSSVEFPEKAEGKDYYPITWSGAMKGFTLQQDMYLILPESKYPEGYQTLGTDGSINLNGHTLTIPGNVLHIGGNITFRGGTLDIRGNYEAKKFKNLDNNGNPIYTSSSCTLRMADAADKMQVAGDFYWDSHSGWTTDINASTSNNMLRAGTIEIGGSFRTDSFWTPSTLEGDSHKEVFKNPEGTEVYFASSSSYFSSVEFPEKAEGKDYYPITWSGAMKGFTLQQDMYLILPESKYPEGYQTLGTDGSINLNGHTLTIPGNVLHIGGNITFRGGTLDIRGNYEAKKFKNLDNNGNPIYTSSSCTLRMADAADKMQVAGDFYWDSHSGWTTDINASTSNNMLRAGTIEIGGSFRTDSSWKPSTLAGDSNTVWLKGNTAKTISMPSSSKFNILKLDRDVDSYSITPNPCWAVLLTGGKYHVQPAASVSIKNTVITNKADGTVTVKNTKVTPNVDITLKLPQKNMELVVSQTGEITIPSNTELTMPARKDKITLPEGGTASASGTVKSGCLVVGDLRIDAQENAAINVSAQGEITLPKDTILTGSDGTKTKLPQGGTITADGELTGDKKPDDEESSGSEESGGSEESDSDEDEWHYPNEIIVSAEAKVRDLKTDAKAEIATNIKEKVYDGNAYTPTVKVTAYDENGKKTSLTEGVDYRVKYRNNVNAGDAVVVIEGNGAYKGSIQKGFRISKKPINKIKIVSGAMIEGNTVSLDRLPIQVCDGAKQLKYGTDYTLAVSNAAEGSSVTKGTLTVTVTAGSDSNYTGICTEKITVFGKPSKNFKGFITSPDDVILEYESTGYTGKPLKPAVKEIRARDEQNNLQESPLGKKDFSVKYQNNKETGTAYVIITGKGGYVGRVIKSFTIVPKNAGNTAFVIKNQAKIDKGVTYNGKLQKPKVTVTDSSTNKTLKLGKDYTVRYVNNLHASDTETNKGKAKIIIKGIGAYSGVSLTKEFKILPIDIKKASVKGTSEQLNIKHAKRLLVKNYDYKIVGDPKPAGKKVEITLEGVGDFKGTVTKKVNP